MSLTLSKLESIIDNTIENESKILIICDREIASIVEEYCDDYDLDMMHNVISDYIPYEHRKSGYAITIDCIDGDYEYYIDFYKHDAKLSGEFDEIHIVGKEFNGFDWEQDKLYFDMGVKHGDMIVDEDDLPITQEEHDRWFKAEGGDSCVECCLDCSDYDCEWNGDIEDCDCDECYEYKKSDEYKNDCCEDDEDDCECDESDEEELTTLDKLLIAYTDEMILLNGCPSCTFELVSRIAKVMSQKGWNDCERYIKGCLNEI